MVVCAGASPWRRLPLRAPAPAPAGLVCPHSGSIGEGTGLGGRREPGGGCSRGAGGGQGGGAALIRGICYQAGAERASPAACCRDLGGGWCPGIDQPPAGAAWTLPARTHSHSRVLQVLPFHLLISASPLPSPRSSCFLPPPPRGVCVRACRGGKERGGEAGRQAGAEPCGGGRAARQRLRRLMCRLNAEASLRSWLPPYAVLGAGRRPLKGHCRQPPPRLGAERGASRNFAPPEAALCGGSGSALRRRRGGACAGGRSAPVQWGLRRSPPGKILCRWYGAAPDRCGRSYIFIKSVCLQRPCAISPSAWRERKVCCFHAIHSMRCFAAPPFNMLN